MPAAATAHACAPGQRASDGDRPGAWPAHAANGAGMAVAPCALRCSQARIHRRGAYLPELNALRAVLCCGSSACGGRMHGGGPSILCVTVRALAEVEPGGPAPEARRSETSRRAASGTDGSQMCKCSTATTVSQNVPTVRDTSTVHLQRWRQMDEFAAAPLCVLKMATNKRTNLQTVCVNFWTSNESC